MYGMIRHIFGNREFEGSSDLFIFPTFFRGMAKSVDLWGNLEDYAYCDSEHEADSKSLKRDYYIVSVGLGEALKDYEQKQIQAK